MTSKQVMLIVTAMMAAAIMPWIAGCELIDKPTADKLTAPYPNRHVWAIVPLRNESGSLSADGLAIADHLQRQLENASNLDVLPVNRTIEAMESLKLTQVRSEADALAIMRKLQADGIVVGIITAYDPYDPPKLGLAIELYADPEVEKAESIDLRKLVLAPTDGVSGQTAANRPPRQPVSIASAVLDAADPEVRRQMQQYANQRGQTPGDWNENWRRYRISMDLYSEFVAYVMSWRLLDAETRRLFVAPKPAD